MNFSQRRSFTFIKIILAVMAIVVVFFSCTTLPKYPEIPKDYDQSKMAQIKLITANEDGFTDQFGGTFFELTCLLIPNWREAGSIVFNEEYMVYVDDKWETSNGKFLNKKYKFNDNAVFSVPAGEYKICADKLVRRPDYKVIQKCMEDNAYKFEPNGKYEMYVYYLSKSEYAGYKTTMYSWNLAITEIKKVKEFKSTPVLFKE